jgi:hypothetical protein
LASLVMKENYLVTKDLESLFSSIIASLSMLNLSSFSIERMMMIISVLGSIGLLYSIVGMKICPVFVLMIVII